MGDSPNIESVYEPGWGETGPQRPEDQVMIENSISAYRLSEENAKGYQATIDGFGVEAEARDILLFNGRDNELKQNRSLMAVNAAMTALMHNSDYPKVREVRSAGQGYVTSDRSPVGVFASNDKYTHTNRESGIELPLENLVFYQVKGSSELEYKSARKQLIDNANVVLQIFSTDFRLPQFPLDDKLKKI